MGCTAHALLGSSLSWACALYIHMVLCDKDHRSKNPYLQSLSPEGKHGLAGTNI